MPNLDDTLGGSSQAAPSGAGLDATLGAAPTGGNLDSVLSSAGGKAAPAAKKSSGGGLLGKIAHGVEGGVKQFANFVNPINQTRGLLHLGGEVAQTAGFTPEQLVEHAKMVDPLYHPSAATVQKTSSPGVNALFGNQVSVPANPQTGAAAVVKGEKGAHVFAAQSPVLAQGAAHLAKTVQAVPDIAVNAAEDTSGNGPGLANSIIGQRIHNEGVLGAGLSTAGDVAMIAGAGAGALDAVPGAGNLAEAGRLEDLANAGPRAPEGGYTDAAHAADLAQASSNAGDETTAAEHTNAAQNLSKAADLRAEVAQQGPLMQAANQARQTLGTVAHAGNQVAGAPAELWTKAIPQVADVLSGGKLNDVANAAAEAYKNSDFGQKRAALHQAGGIIRDQLAGETQRLSAPVNQAFTDAAKLLPNQDDRLAVQLVRRGDVNPLTAPQLSALSDEQLQAHIDRTGLSVTPEAVRKAVEYTANPAAFPAMGQAAQTLDAVQAPADTRYAQGYGASQALGAPALAERAAKVAGEPSPTGVANRQGAIQKMIDMQQAKLDSAMQQGLSERPAPLSAAQERQVAARNARADVTERLGSERQGISTRAASDETNANAQRLANKRSVADAEREIAARSQRISDLQSRQANVPNELRVQAPQVRTALIGADQVRQSLLQAAQEAYDSGDVARSQSLAGLAGKSSLTAAELKAAGVSPTFLPGGEVPEKPTNMAPAGRRISSIKKLGSERMRQTNVAPLDFEGQQELYNKNIAGQVRNALPQRMLDEMAGKSTDHVADTALAGAALTKALADKNQVPVGIVREGGTAKLAQLPDDQVHPGVQTMPKAVLDRYQKVVFPKDPSKFAQVLQSVEKAGRVTKLLGTGFPIHKLFTDAVLDRVAGGVSMKELAAQIPGALEQRLNGTMPADIGAIQPPPANPDASLATRVGHAVTNAGMKPFSVIDNTNRAALNNALREQGLSPLQAAERTRAVAGDLAETNRQLGGARHVFTYPGWQLHLAKTLASLPAEHPAGLAMAGSVGQADKKAHPNQQATTGGIEDFLNPFGSIAGLGQVAPGSSVGQSAEQRLGSMIAPLPEMGSELAGSNLRRAGAVSVPGTPFTQASHPGVQLNSNAPGLILHTLVPQIAQVGDALHQAQGPGGYIPYRYDTGGVETKKGTPNMEPGTTKLDALARLLGFPHATKLAPKKKK